LGDTGTTEIRRIEMLHQSQKTEISKHELNLDELENVTGGAVDTDLWNAFTLGLAKGFAEAGGHVNIQLKA
jgi:hypothetical protein